MSLSIVQLLDRIGEAKGQSSADWTAVLNNEIATGRLQQLQGFSVTDQKLYDMAIAYLQAPTPLVVQARIVLEGARRLDQTRGGGTAADTSLAALTEYEATVILGTAAIQEGPDAGAGTGTVV